jgi:predicted ATPase/DNA-binding SARP family transcriptional activator
MEAALGRHDELIANAIAAHGGVVLKARGEGDSTFSVFVRATDAVRAAHAVQLALLAEPWSSDAPLAVRFAVHTGEAIEHDDDYFGPAVNRVARLRGIAGGGQVLVSGATAPLVADQLPHGARLVELGSVTLRDLARPEAVWALVGEGLPDVRPLATGPWASSSLRYGILGPLAAWDRGGEPVRLPSEQQRVLLAVLVVNANKTVSADRLIEELWGDQLPTDPRVALRTQISRLRKRLDDGALATEDAGYRLHTEPGACDAGRFEALLADGLVGDALALWRGPALGEFAERPFARAEAMRLDALRLAARETRAELLLELNRPAAAIADLEAVLIEAPEREHARGLLMRALYMTGRQTDALRVYQEWRRHLADDLGLDPAPELQHLEHRILNHDLVGPADTGIAWHSLPRPVSTFVGRDTEVTTVAAALGEHRVVVLCGPGGVGKTRLAIEAAGTVADRYPNGIAFCDLASVARDADVVRVVAAAVGLEERSARRLDDQLVTYLEHRHCLLVIDNCEHVINAAAQIVDRVVRHTAAVTILATTREPLAVAGEQLVTVAPLATEGNAASALRLFVDRARAVLPDFDAAGDREQAIQDICRQLDGLPLAIELAAARVRSMTLRDLAGGLDRRFQLLVGARRADERHRSLRAVLDWSYDLLSADEGSVFDQLSVFASGFDLDAARAVVGDDFSSDEATEAVLRLVDCSLVVVRHGDGAMQYALLDSMRSYGAERLRDRAGLDAARGRHAVWALGLAEDAANGLASPNENEWASRVGRHFAEMRAAHEWLVGRDPPAALHLVAALRPYALWRRAVEIGRWAEVSASVAAGGDAEALPAALLCAFTGAWQRGDYAAAWELARTAVQAVAPRAPEEVRYVVDVQADVAFIGGDVATAVRLHRRAAELAIAAGDLLQAMWTLGSVSHALTYGAELEESRRVAEQSAVLAAECGSPTAAAMQDWVVGELLASTDPAAAQSHLERAIRTATSVGSRQVAVEAEFGLAIVKARQGDVDGALADCHALLADSHATRTGVLPRDLVRVIEVLTLVGAYREAALLYGAAMSPRRSAGRFPVSEAALLEAASRLRSELGDAEVGRLALAGADLDEAEVVGVAVDAVREVTRN